MDDGFLGPPEEREIEKVREIPCRGVSLKVFFREWKPLSLSLVKSVPKAIKVEHSNFSAQKKSDDVKIRRKD